MKIAIYGAGAVGGYFGARLLQAGMDVGVIARGEHLRAIQQHGIQIQGISGNFTVKPNIATDDVTQVGVVDLVIVGVKAWQVPQAAEKIASMLGEQSVVLPLQNGVDAPAQLAAVLGKERVLIGLCQIAAQLSAPGVITHTGIEPYLAFGEWDNRRSARVLELQKMFTKAAIKAEVPADITAALWDKFLFIASFGALGAVTRAPAGVIRQIQLTRQLLENVMREILIVAWANGVALTEDAISKRMKFIDGLPFEMMASMARDVINAKPSELDYLIGAVVRLGREKGLEIPLSQTIYACLLPQEQLAREKYRS
ncbi:MAG: 2-dehydropantoate 2-reductase [Anaerolineales bacterium]